MLGTYYGAQHYVRFHFRFKRQFIFYALLRSAGPVRSPAGEKTMIILAGLLSLGLLIYLFVAFFWPERFG